MPFTEQTITTASTASEFSIPADDSENVADGGPADIGRADVNLKFTEVDLSVQ